MARSFDARSSHEFGTFRSATKERATCNCMTHGDSTSQVECRDRRISASERARITADNTAEFTADAMSHLDYAMTY